MVLRSDQNSGLPQPGDTGASGPSLSGNDIFNQLLQQELQGNAGTSITSGYGVTLGKNGNDLVPGTNANYYYVGGPVAVNQVSFGDGGVPDYERGVNPSQVPNNDALTPNIVGHIWDQFGQQNGDAKQLQQALFRAGYLKNKKALTGNLNKDTIAAAKAAYGDMSQVAADGFEFSDIFDFLHDGVNGAGGSGGSGGAGGTSTSTSTSIKKYSASEVQGAVDQLSQNMLGRYVSQQDLGRYTSAVNAAEAANPLVSTTTQSTDTNGNSVSNTTNNGGGIDPTAVISNLIRGNPEYGTYQVATTYMDAFLKAIASPV